MKRFIVAIIATLFSLPLFAQYEIYTGPPKKVFKPGTIVELTDVLWIEYMAKSPKSALGTYERCGNYLFVYIPKGKEKEKKAPMVGFAYPNEEGKVGVTILRNAALTHVQETATETHVETYRDEEKREHFNVFLLGDEIRKVRACGKIAIEKKK